MQKVEKTVLPLITFAIILGVWQLVASTGLYNSYLFPSPVLVARAIREQVISGSLWKHITESLFRFFLGYIGAAATSIPVGLVLGWHRKLWTALDPFVQVLRPISPIAWFPLVSLWFGIGNLPAIVIIFIAAFYPILLSTVAAVQNVDPIYLKVARNFGTPERDILRKIVFPAAFPYIAMGLHLAIGSAWVFLVAGEMLGVRSGLGFLIIDGRNVLRTDLVLAGILIIGLLGLIIDRAIGYLEKRIKGAWGLVK